MDKKKDLGQVFTPQWVVELMLNRIGYIDNPDILHKKVLEPSCGDGSFLQEIAARFIRIGLQSQLSKPQIVTLLENNIVGYDYDEEALQEARQNLNVIAHKFELGTVNWNLHFINSLTSEDFGSFDYVIGNPPYIRVHNMNSELRELVKTFESSSGTTDLYVIFFELGLKWLKPDGVLVYITPNSWMRNASQQQFRDELLEHRQICSIIDFGAMKVFPNASTYTAITILTPTNSSESFIYENQEEKWVKQINWNDFSHNKNHVFYVPSPKNEKLLNRLADYSTLLEEKCVIQNGLATLRDKLFLQFSVSVENGLLKPVVKASTYKGEPVSSRMLFPYKLENGRLKGLSEKDLQTFYPEGYKYLSSVKEELETRALDKNALWFHYGRSQGLLNILKPKLVFSHVVSPHQTKINAYILPAETLVYSGLFITEIEPGFSLERIKQVIESTDFLEYVRMTGKPMGGGYRSFGSKTVKQFSVIAD